MFDDSVAIVILNWNGLNDTLECLDSLLKIDCKDFELYVVDNASSGNDVEVIKNKYGKKIKLFVNKSNLGFAKGNNVATEEILKEKKHRYVLLLNNDTVVNRDFLTKLISAIKENKKAAIAGPKMYYYDYFGKKNIIWYGGGKVNLNTFPGYSHVGIHEEDTRNAIETTATDFVSGACILIDSKKINPILDEHFYFGCEDIDKALEAKRLGYEAIYVPSSLIWHKVSASRSKSFKSKLRDRLTTLRLLKKNNKYFYLYLPKYLYIILSSSIVFRTKKTYN